MRRLVPAVLLLLFAASTAAAAPAAPLMPLVPRASLQGIVRAARHPDLRWPAITDVRPEIERLYAKNGWQPLWLESARPGKAAKMLIARLAAADSLGLEPTDYDAAWLGRTAAEFERAPRIPPAQQLASFDVGMSVAAARFVSALACGRVDPKTLDAQYDIPRHCPAVDSTVAQLRDVKRQGAVLLAVQPQFQHYQRLKNGLARYRALAVDTTLVPLPVITANSRPGVSLPAAASLRRLLRATGDLPEAKVPAPARDTVYAPDLVEAVKRFQGRQGFLPDGVLWSQTLDQLSRPFRDRVRQIELTLERWRWLPSTYDVPPVIVNIPEFRLYAFNALPDRRESLLAMDVLVGAAGANETPEFSAEMTYVVFRPFWEVPADLAMYELGPRAEWDRENMERLGYILARRDGASSTGLPLTPANLKRLGRDLRLRQKPGSLNALGLIKFMLPNPHDIYLHDTPVPGLFVMPRRDFSHGCIRVSDPVTLAEHVLRGQPGWTPERVKAAMESSEDNVRVNLPQGIPVFIVYATAVAAESGEVYFYTDIYQRDAKLDALLRKVAPFPRTSPKRPKPAGQGRISTGVPMGINR